MSNKITCGLCTRSLGRAHGCVIKHDSVDEVAACYARHYEFEAYYAAEAAEAERTCSLCDAVGHGYPGGGPCPLEERGYWDARADEDREAAMGILSYEQARDLAAAGVL